MFDPDLDNGTTDPSLLRKLFDIQSRDPDGGEIRPTEQAYRDHEQWAVSTYGADLWSTYRRGGWDGRRSDW